MGDETTCVVYVPAQLDDFLLSYPVQGSIRFNKTEQKNYKLAKLEIDGRTRREVWIEISCSTKNVNHRREEVEKSE